MSRKRTSDDQRQDFIDQTAIALFAAGWPKQNIFTHAAMLWRLRDEHLATANGKSPQPKDPSEK